MGDRADGLHRLRTIPPRQAVLIVLALLVATLAVTRIQIQSITIDEADSYLVWATRPNPAHWEGSENNHVLNSGLMRLATTVFGPTHMAVRASAVVGSIAFVGAALAFCLGLSTRPLPTVPLFLCLTLNPFTLDYLVPARGYSSALGFLMVALAVAALGLSREPRPELRSLAWTCAWCTTAATLSFTASFAFGFAAVATVAAAFVWAVRSGCAGPAARPWKVRGTLLAACVAPGMAILLVLAAPSLLHWPANSLRAGSKSLAETTASLVESSLYQPNENLVNPLLLPLFRWIAPYLFPALAIAAVAMLAALALDRRQTRRTAAAAAPREAHIAVYLLAVAAGTFALHWLAFRHFGLMLPRDRTGAFLPPMLMLACGALAAVPSRSTMARAVRPALHVALIAVAIYFTGAMRLTYFQLWRWNADTQRIYAILADYNHRYGVRDVPVTWRCVAALNFYRVASGRETLREFHASYDGPYPPGQDVYVVNFPTEHGMVSANGWKRVYLGEVSEIAVVVNPNGPSKIPVE